MDIKTKFGIDDKVWTILQTKAVQLEVYRIVVEVICNRHVYEKYYLRFPYREGEGLRCTINDRYFTDGELFATKEELVNQL